MREVAPCARDACEGRMAGASCWSKARFAVRGRSVGERRHAGEWKHGERNVIFRA